MENDLISRSALLVEILKGTIILDDLYCIGIMAGVDAIRKNVENAPAVDAVEVVRCKDCKWLYRNSEMCCCKKHAGLALIKPDGSSFCSYGERRCNNG